MLGTLVGALFLCVRTAGGGESLTAAAHPPGHSSSAAAYVCPGDLPGCSPFAHVAPGVLPVPPPVVLPPRAEPPPHAVAEAAGAIRPPGALARAPDLHVLQVLRN
ncbi:hypothetical protein [Streptomyces bambusae]|uniref:Secreted protein n=1 Tax=Streptomyces bambusae TaxID=1550616 RepID=A0ABS6Z7F6_9ACTN|nr:hypothetical protein [Streptomyces bambusae]MBW5483704.1 hypothetical protein [Streptomyces bambusae]